MLVYFIPVTWLYVLSNLKIKKYKNIVEKITVILLGIFLCTTYFNGSDWRAYELMYKYASFSGIKNFYKEKGFYFYMLLFKTLGFDFWWFFIITKLGCFYILYLKIKYYTNNISGVLALFCSYVGFYLFIDCPLRNLIAVSIFFVSEKYIREKKYLRYFLCFILALFFHSSAIITILLVFFYHIYRLKIRSLVIIILSIFIVFLDQNFIVKIVTLFPSFIEEKVLWYMNTEKFVKTFISFGSLEKVSIVLLLIGLKNKIQFKQKSIISLVIIYFFTYRLGLTIDILSRMTHYFIIYYLIGITYIFQNLKKLKTLFKILFFIYSLLLTTKTIYKGYEYIPYTSYFSYIFKEKPSYEYRSNYHFIKWEERFGKKYQRK